VPLSCSASLEALLQQRVKRHRRPPVPEQRADGAVNAVQHDGRAAERVHLQRAGDDVRKRMNYAGSESTSYRNKGVVLASVWQNDMCR